uniref:Symplectin/biotinidase-like protein 1 n=1 Tax=Phylliroe bucephala TaxID=1903125 RepID=A0A2Z5EQ48_9GAST|nr:symplectin/biotinidase-like protein 1 [Phylliroe bucephala]
MNVLVSFFLVFILTKKSNAVPTPSSPPSSFRAAVYEHIPIMTTNKSEIKTRDEALEIMGLNLAVYKTQTERAKQQGAQIIVFPEDGIYGIHFTRTSISPYLEEIPNPETIQWSPCSEPNRFPNTEVQKNLSCLAQQNGVYLVANMGDRVPCKKLQDPKCPPDGRYQFNTDVAYGPDGMLLAKYHKTHLFYEDQFNTPEAKVVSFDTPFGRVGMLVCFDLLFKEPAVSMVIDHNITIIAFPTAWMDALPLLSAIGYHSSFARGLGVNFLSANIHLPVARFHGSGIFTPKGMSSFYYDNDPKSSGKLLVSTIDIVDPKKDAYNERIEGNGLSNRIKGDEFEAKIFNDIFTLRLLEDFSGEFKVCQNKVCCSLTFTFKDELLPPKDLFAFGVFDGQHTYQGQYYFQICTLIKCANNTDRMSCGLPTKTSFGFFKDFTISGNFQTSFIYPQVIFSDSDQLILGNLNSWSFHNDTIRASGPDLNRPLLSATLLGRDYTRDDMNMSLITSVEKKYPFYWILPM